jgi:hypothetical protein
MEIFDIAWCIIFSELKSNFKNIDYIYCVHSFFMFLLCLDEKGKVIYVISNCI